METRQSWNRSISTFSIRNAASWPRTPQNLCTRFALVFWYILWQTIYQYFPVVLHWHQGNHTIASVPMNQAWRIWVYKSNEYNEGDDISKQNKTSRVHISWYIHVLYWTIAWFVLVMVPYLITSRLWQCLPWFMSLSDQWGSVSFVRAWYTLHD